MKRRRRPGFALEYWPDIEGLEHRNTVTDFGLPEGTFFDCAFVHLMTTATLDRLSNFPLLSPRGRIASLPWALSLQSQGHRPPREAPLAFAGSFG